MLRCREAHTCFRTSIAVASDGRTLRVPLAFAWSGHVNLLD